ncbi:unnamed protein product [Acanthoscelides obtectus]|uniref:Uncharacterized protein n=1 Tax=Acanthoscelides obtectus TaxID=200917 RepID=A0A9P0PH10_ACAOB|nr:unnamed protein product [Acanthoscelides obtectus]CAK1674797.1 hypothetical protein AOBTE_LOCUS29743 [Acanthoscelides obtectus]
MREIRNEIKSHVSSIITSAMTSLSLESHKKWHKYNKKSGGKITVLEKKIEYIISFNSTVVNDLKEETSILRSENEQLMRKIESLDQGARTDKLRIFNLVEKDSDNLFEEIINRVNSRMGINIKQEDTLDCRRLGKKQDGKRRGIILKLNGFVMKQNIYNKKNLLKVSNICIKDLTENRLKLMVLGHI